MKRPIGILVGVIGLGLFAPAVQAKGLQVFDANLVQVGQLVGTFEQNSQNYPKVALNPGTGTIVFLKVASNKFMGAGDGGAYFQALNCVGPPLHDVPISTPQSMVPSTFVQNNMLYVARSTGGTTLAAQSFFSDFVDTCSNFPSGFAPQLPLFPFDPIVDLSTLFTSPFSLR